MPQPFTATARITLPVTTQVGPHKIRHYVKNATLVGGVWMINTRTSDQNDLDWANALDAMAHAVSYLFATAASNGDGVLEVLENGVWQPKAFSSTLIDQKGGSTSPAQQGTIVFRDTNFDKIKVVLLEINVATLTHTNSYAALTGAALNCIAEYTDAHIQQYAPYLWMVSRSEDYLADTPFVGWTVAPNHKARRALGLT